MEKLPKRIVQQLRKLAGTAYKIELDHHIGKLAKKFEEWENKKINCWELNDCIHKFHDGISREIYKTYNYDIDDIFLVARAVVYNFLQKEEIPKEAIPAVEHMINYLKREE